MANKNQKKKRDQRVREEQEARRKTNTEEQEIERIEARNARRAHKEAAKNYHDIDLDDYGDDGKPMTSARNFMKTILGIYAGWAMIAVPLAVCMFLLSCFPAQAYAVFGLLGFEDTVNGWSPIVIFRIETVVTIVGLSGLLVNMFGFSWMFGQIRGNVYILITVIMAIAFGGYLIFSIVQYTVPDPISIIHLILLVLVWIASWRVERERPFL